MCVTRFLQAALRKQLDDAGRRFMDVTKSRSAAVDKTKAREKEIESVAAKLRAAEKALEEAKAREWPHIVIYGPQTSHLAYTQG